MWWLWPHLRRLWAGTGTVIVGLLVTYLYSLSSKQALPDFRVVANFLSDYWPWFGGALTAVAAVSVFAERAYRRHQARAPRPLLDRRGPVRRLLAKLGGSLRPVAPALRSRPAPNGATLPGRTLPGRATELAQLGEWFAQVSGGTRRVVLVSGDPGVGKTTLVTAFLDTVARDRSVRVAREQCAEQHGPIEPYVPVLDALIRLCREPGSARLVAILHRLAPGWLAQMPSLVSVEDRERLQSQTQGTTQSRLLREMVEALEAMAADSPLVLLLEDLQWSDPSTLDLIGALARRSEPARLLILGTHPPVAALPGDHPLPALIEQLKRRRLCEELPLQKLSEAALAEDRARLLEEGAQLRERVARPPGSMDAKRIALVAGAAVLALGAAIGAIMSWRQFAPKLAAQPAGQSRSIRSIAVLPLDNYSGDPSQEYFADGMTDELTADLARISALRVISRGSVMRFKGASRPPTPAIAKLLNVDAVIEGSVLRAGDKVRITAELIDAPADQHLWADSFERDSRDVFVLQDELASAIAKAIAVRLTPAEQARLTTASSVDPAAHDAYLKGRYFIHRPNNQNLKKALEYFRQASAIDPHFVLPYTGIADAYSWADDLYASPADVMPQAKSAAARALQLDDSLAEAHASQGYVDFEYDFDFAGAESQYRRAIELRPNYADAHYQYGFVLTMEGRFAEAIAESKQAMASDPLSASIPVLAAYPLMFQGKYDAARALVRQGMDLDPASDFGQYTLGLIDLESGKFGAAIVELEEARRPDALPYVDGWLGYAYAAAGNHAKALTIIKALDEAAKRHYVSPFTPALIYLGLGDKERALAGLAQAYEVRSQWLFYLKVDRIFDPLRTDPRFIALVKKVNLEQ